MLRTNRGWWIAAALLTVGLAARGDAQIAAVRVEDERFADPALRRAALAPQFERLATLDPSEHGWANLASRDLNRLYAACDDDAVRQASAMAVVPNPEPSSMLVWGAAAVGLLAAGYGVKRRQSPMLPA